MAIDTIGKIITKDWQLVASFGEWQSIQFRGTQPVDIVINAGATPAIDADSLQYDVLDGINPSTFGDGEIWAKSRNISGIENTKIVVVTK